MKFFIGAIFGALIIAWIVIIYYAVRNERVYRYRIAMVYHVSDAAQVDINKGQPWRWRYDMMSAVSYNQMLYSLRNFDSFYKDHSFHYHKDQI